MNIVITGASRGIGFETVKLLAQNPSNKILAISRNGLRLEELKKLCNQIQPKNNLTVLEFDIAAKNYQTLIEILNAKFKSVDVLINNAGTLISKPFESLSDDEWMDIYSVNVFGSVKIIRELLPYFDETRKSHVVNISSIGGMMGSSKFIGLSAYSSSKGALTILTECLAEEFKDRNIAVNCLALGAVQTEMLQQAFPGYTAPVTANEMAIFVSNFALTGQHYFNGKILPVSSSTP